MMEAAEDQQSLVRQQYLQTFFAKYTDLVNYVHSLPIHGKMKENSITRFDEGMFWVREGIVHLQTLAPQEPVAEPTPLE